VPFFKSPWSRTWDGFTILFFALVIVGSSNAVNLTDGLDGLAIGLHRHGRIRLRVSFPTPREFSGRRIFTGPFYPFTAELTVVCAALIALVFGFLWFNCHPAKVFMGDTGSLAIGG